MFRPQLLAIFRELKRLLAYSVCFNLCCRDYLLDTVCTVGDCHYCPQSVQESIVQVLAIGGQAANGIMFTALL